ncbi:MAG: PAS domain S-box protein, partial [Dehalococcoidia bacterium]
MTHLAEPGNSMAERMLSVIRQAGAGIVVTDGQGNIRLANPRFWEIAGRSEAEGHAVSTAEITHPDDVEATLQAIRSAIETGSESSVEKRYVRLDGSVAWARASVTQLDGVEPGEVLAMAVVVDITAEREAREALASAEGRYRALLEGTPAMVVVADAAGRATFTNRAWEEFSGLAAKDGPHWAERGYIHSEDLKRATAAWNAARRAGVGYDIDYRVRNGKGDYCWVAFKIRPVTDEEGAVVSWTSAAIEIDERVRAQEALAASEARLRALVDATPAMVVMTDADGGVQLVSQEWTAFTGLDADAMTHWRELQTMHPDDAAATAEERRRGLLSQAGYNVDYRLRRFDGDYRWVSASVRPALAADGRVLGWMFVGLDVDDRVRVRERLEALNADLRQLAESIPAIVITSPEDRTEPPFANRLWTEYTGIPLEDVTQETVQRLVHRDDAAAVLEAWERSSTAREPYELEFRLRGHDGAYRWFAWRTQPLIDAGNLHLGWITAGVDIDDQVRLREQIEHTNEHLQLLADAGQAIANAVDFEAAVGDTASVLVPSFAGWCSVDILVEEQSVVRKVGVHSPALVDEETARMLRDLPPSWDDASDHLTGVLQSGEGLYIPRIPSDLSVSEQSDEHVLASRGMRPNSTIAVPLR